MAQVIPQVNRFSEIGKAFGEGLGSQIPKEIDRLRLMKGLDNFQQNSQEKTPFQQAIDLYKIPGFTPEMAYTLVPLLRQQQQREAGVNFPGGQGQPQGQREPEPIKFQPLQQGQISGGQGERPNDILNTIAQSSQKPSIKTAEATQKQLTPFIEPSIEQQYQAASDLSRANPVAFPTPQDALPVVQAQIATERGNHQAQQQAATVADATSERLKTGLQKFWGTDATKPDVPPAVQNVLLRKTERDLLDPYKKMSEQDVIEANGKIARQIAKQLTNIQNIGFTQRWLGNTQANLDAIDSTSKIFKELGASNEFASILEDQFGFTTPLAARFAYDLPKDVKKDIKDLEPNYFTYTQKNKEQRGKTLEKFAWDIADKITDQDSLLAIAQRVGDKGYNIRDFMSYMKTLQDKGRLKPSALHDEEFSKSQDIYTNPYEIYLKAMFGLGD